MTEIPKNSVVQAFQKGERMARPKGNKIRLTIELELSSPALNAAKEQLVKAVEEMFPSLIGLRADVSEVVVEAEKEEKE